MFLMEWNIKCSIQRETYIKHLHSSSADMILEQEFHMTKAINVTVMIRVNCFRCNMAAADAQSPELGIVGLWVWHTSRLNVWVGFECLQVYVLKCHSVFWHIFTVVYESYCAVWTHECYFLLRLGVVNMAISLRGGIITGFSRVKMYD